MSTWRAVLPLNKIEVYILLIFWTAISVGAGVAGGYIWKESRNDFQRGADAVHKAYLSGVEREIVDDQGNKKTVVVRVKR